MNLFFEILIGFGVLFTAFLLFWGIGKGLSKGFSEQLSSAECIGVGFILCSAFCFFIALAAGLGHLVVGGLQ
jgi:hypothetical protein